MSRLLLRTALIGLAATVTLTGCGSLHADPASAPASPAPPAAPSLPGTHVTALTGWTDSSADDNAFYRVIRVEHSCFVEVDSLAHTTISLTPTLCP